MSEARRIFARGLMLGFEPDPILPVSDWADGAIILPSDVTPTPGPWVTDRVPFMREILDALSPSDPCERVVFQKSAQVGATVMLVVACAHIAARAPGPAMVLQPTVDMAKAFSHEKLAPILRSSPSIASRFVEQKSRDGGSATMFKRFPGGFLVLTGANSAAGLRMRSLRYLFKDEIDAYPADVDGEGDPSELADKRTAAFSNRKIFEASTPTTEDGSRIAPKYAAGTKGRYHIACPHCGGLQHLDWERLDFSEKGTPEAPVYPCVHCLGLMENHHKRQMLAGGQWVHDVEWKPGLAKSFHINELYSPFRHWAETVADFLKAKLSPETLKVWINTALGEVWRERGEAPDHVRLWERRGDYVAGKAPVGVIFVTAGVDVQADRLEVEIQGWGEGERCWSLDYVVLPGRPSEFDVWQDLDRLLRAPIAAEQGEAFDIRMTCIDSGYLADMAYQFARSGPNRAAVKGVASPTAPIIGMRPSIVDVNYRGRMIKSGATVWPVGVHQAKLKLYERLRLARDDAGDSPAGYCDFPKDYDQHYFQMLTAETLVTRVIKGFARQEWQKFGRNEALDCRVYGFAAAHILGMHRLSPTDWRAMAEQRGLNSGEAVQPDLVAVDLVAGATRQAQAPRAVPQAAPEYYIPEASWL